MDLAHEVARRRTFAIISHPDAGKTTLTEKLLLYGGALHMAGAVKSRKAARHAISDWMSIEQERGISITSSVLQFDHEGKRLNLLDTPGHADFSEDTYRTLAAVDSAIMLMDAAKGVEDRTRRLFEVCRMRNMPILAFVNKMDRPGKEPLELLDEVSNILRIKCVPLNWPIGSGPDFKGVLDRRTQLVHLFERVEAGASVAPELVLPLDHPQVKERLGDALWAQLQEDAELIEEAGDPWDLAAFLAGEMIPFFFGSAMTNFGVGPLLSAIEELAPPPLPRPTVQGQRPPSDPQFSAFVFKIQANMNPRHRDRIAFIRVVSGEFTRGMDVTLARSGETIRLSKPHTFMASERSIVEQAVPGDIVGLYDPGELRIGDTLFVGEPVRFQGIPRFAPEHFARVRLKDPTRRKHLQNGLQQLSQEGTIQLFVREGLGPADPYLGAVGLLQFEVLKVRLEQEYGVKCDLEPSRYALARWIAGDPRGREWIENRTDYALVEDRDGYPVVLAETPYSLQYALNQAPGLKLLDVSPLGAEDLA
jgi:peptide chain release factor 3